MPSMFGPDRVREFGERRQVRELHPGQRPAHQLPQLRFRLEMSRMLRSSQSKE
jgi:hypothetical protein